MRRMKYEESCLQIPEEILEAAGLNQEPDVLIGMAPEVILITSRNLDQTKREKIGEALWGFSEDLEIPLESEGLYLPEEMLMEAGLPCDPDLLDMYLEDGRIVIEPLEGFEEELLEDAWDEAREDAVLSRVPVGLQELLKSIGIHPASVRDAIVEGGYEF
ncbi:hypothetical protein [Angelakisella massiliensis]|uniref:hypothetical protein n=1 Tax=Angelakisella massiliensis TaxID=1871018 RepID=UPI0008F8CF48|nr:hypothetical protein [Angelakisella massiliensis]